MAAPRRKQNIGGTLIGIPHLRLSNLKHERTDIIFLRDSEHRARKVCHEEKDLAAVKAHGNTVGKACVACHNPHSGKDKYLLKSEANTKAQSGGPALPTAK